MTKITESQKRATIAYHEKVARIMRENGEYEVARRAEDAARILADHPTNDR